MKKLKLIGICFFCLVFFSFCSDSPNNHPFSYDLQLSFNEKNKERALICFHGVGGSHLISNQVDPLVNSTLVSFNFPDHGNKCLRGSLNLQETSFGAIEEILPALYVMKKTIIDRGFSEVSLYGYSAGGGALINCLAVLNGSLYDSQLKRIGINDKEKKKILEVIQKGSVILDTPLKSVDEVVAFHDQRNDLEPIAKKYKKNQMDPMDSIEKWKGLSLKVLLHFQTPDEVLSNRDDKRFIKKIKKYNLGTTEVLIGNDTGHSLPHSSMWAYYLTR